MEDDPESYHVFWGVIDAKQVLNALNITHTCKQPSWFSKQLAEDIIMRYCSSDTIVDTFAGKLMQMRVMNFIETTLALISIEIL